MFKEPLYLINSIVEKLDPKFPGFLINLDFDEKKKLYKLISQTNDKRMGSKNLCLLVLQ